MLFRSNLNIGKLFTSKFVETGPSFYKKRIYRAAVSQILRNTVLGDVAVSLKNAVIRAAMPCRLVNRGPQYLYFQGQAVPGNTMQFLPFLDCWSQGEGTAIS